MLKQDLEYFKKQRELLEMYVRQKGGGPPATGEK